MMYATDVLMPAEIAAIERARLTGRPVAVDETVVEAQRRIHRYQQAKTEWAATRAGATADTPHLDAMVADYERRCAANRRSWRDDIEAVARAQVKAETARRRRAIANAAVDVSPLAPTSEQASLFTAA